jgi:PhnB protein
MPVLDSYLFFHGDCAEAMRFYERTLGGKLEALMTYGESPDPQQCPVESRDLVMHARLVIDGRALMASDTPPGHAPAAKGGFAISLGYEKAQDARRIFDALSQGGTVTMPMQKTFWAETFGMLTDRFGTTWFVGGAMQAA